MAESDPSKNMMQDPETKFNLSIFIGIILVGMFVRSYFGNVTENGSSGPASALLWGYSLIMFSLIGILFVRVKMSRDSGGQSMTNYIMGPGAPMFLLIFNLLWLISLNLKYFTEINQGRVSNEYYEFSFLNSILIFIQIIVSMEPIISKAYNFSPVDAAAKLDDKGKGRKEAMIGVISFVFLIINFIMSGIQQVILDYFTTDG